MRFAPGLNEKAGRAGEPRGLGVVLAVISTADLGRRPAALGVDADIVLEGKQNGGLGGGPSEGTDTSAWPQDSLRSSMPPMGSERWRGL